MSKFNQPLGGNEMPRYAGPGTMFRLPSADSAAGLDIAIAGVPLDIGTSNRSGTRFGPRQIRNESVLVRPYCMATAAAPFDSFQVADVGDVALKGCDARWRSYDRVADPASAAQMAWSHGARAR